MVTAQNFCIVTEEYGAPALSTLGIAAVVFIASFYWMVFLGPLDWLPTVGEESSLPYYLTRNSYLSQGHLSVKNSIEIELSSQISHFELLSITYPHILLLDIFIIKSESQLILHQSTLCRLSVKHLLKVET